MWRKISSVYVSGRALFLAVVIAFISAIIALLFILSRHYGFVVYSNLEKQAQLSDHLQISITQAIQPESTIPYHSETLLPFEGDEAVSCTLVKKPWGAYSLVHAQASWKNMHRERVALYGYRQTGEERTGLYLADHGHYLAVSGDSYLSGVNYLPALGARKAYIDGHSFKYAKLIQGTSQTSNKTLPKIPDEVYTYLTDDLVKDAAGSDSLLTISALHKGVLENSFLKPLIRIQEKEELEIRDEQITGHCILQSETRIRIGSRAKLQNCICIAPVIEVDEDFEGSVQLIASDTIILGPEVSLLYPSTVICTGKNQSAAYCSVGEGTVVQGLVLISSELSAAQDVYLKLSEEASVFGEVYCSGKLEHRARIYGSLYCDKLVLQTPRGYYENHLLNAWVHPDKLEANFCASSLLWGDSQNYRGGVIAWLK